MWLSDLGQAHWAVKAEFWVGDTLSCSAEQSGAYIDFAKARPVPGFNVVDGNTNTSDAYGHGTFVAGVAAAVGNNAIDVTGVAFNTSIMPLRISTDTAGSASEFDIALAIEYAADHGAKVCNVSFGSDFCDSPIFLDAGTYMQSKGGLVVQAAGNSGLNRGCPTTPQVIIVSATDENDNLASFSNIGNEIAVAAPGVHIISTVCNACTPLGGGELGSGDGTSFAAPIAAGVLALIFSIDQTFTAAQAQQILFDTADDLGPAGYDISYGWGRVNAAKAVGVSGERSVVFRQENLVNVYAYPNPWDIRHNSRRQITIANIPDDSSVKIFTLSGLWVTTLQPSNGRAVWTLTNDSGQSVASGLYLYLVKTNSGNMVRGKIAIIK